MASISTSSPERHSPSRAERAGKTTTTEILEGFKAAAAEASTLGIAVVLALIGGLAFGTYPDGRTFAWADLGIVAAWGVAAAFFAVRRFSWLPGQR